MTRRLSIVVPVAVGLACGGLGPAAPALPPLDAGDGEITLAWLEADGDGCAWKAGRWPSPGPRTVATFAGACPASPSFAVAETGPAAVFAAGRIVRIEAGAARELPPPPAGPEMVAFREGQLLACAEVPAEREELEGGRVKLTADGETHEVDLQGAVDAALARSWRFDGRGWAEDETGPVTKEEGTRGPYCSGLPGWPASGTVVAETARVAPPSGWKPAADPAPFAGIAGGPEGAAWLVSPNGAFAARGTGEVGLVPSAPFAWRPSGGPWAALPETTGDVVARGPWLLITSADGSHLRDVRTGETAWSTTSRAVEWTAALPEAAATPAEPEPEPPADAPRGGQRRWGKAKGG